MVPRITQFWSDPKHAMKLTSNLIPLLVSGGVCGSAHPLLALRRLHLSLLLSRSQTETPPKTIEEAKTAQQQLDDQVRTSAEVVYGLSTIHPAGHPARGVALVELGKILLVDEPLPLTHEYMTSASQFPPHGEGRLRLAHETLVRSLKEIQIGFGREADGGELGKQARKLIVDVESELTVWVGKARRGAVNAS
jgi:SET and MYND domain-containing protein